MNTVVHLVLLTTFCYLSAEPKAGVMRSRHGKGSPLPRPRDVRQCCRAAARRQLLGSGHPPARGHPPLLRPLPGQASVCGFQRAAAHLPLLHERPLPGGRRLAGGRGAGLFRPQAPPQQELTNREAGLLPQITMCSMD